VFGLAASFIATAGVESLETRIPLDQSDRFAFYSITKTFVATVVLQLVDEGFLTLDDTVDQWLDDPAVMRIPNVDQITLRQLLNHTGGVYDYTDDAGPFQRDAFGEPANWSKVWTPLGLLSYADGGQIRAVLRSGPTGALLEHRLHSARTAHRAGDGKPPGG
jgi:D-alanyl-D-alanine carboxypeptidase